MKEVVSGSEGHMPPIRSGSQRVMGWEREKWWERWLGDVSG
jgi:hypothetical protein